jgi:hypothetical protein
VLLQRRHRPQAVPKHLQRARHQRCGPLPAPPQITTQYNLKPLTRQYAIRHPLPTSIPNRFSQPFFQVSTYTANSSRAAPSCPAFSHRRPPSPRLPRTPLTPSPPPPLTPHPIAPFQAGSRPLPLASRYRRGQGEPRTHTHAPSI